LDNGFVGTEAEWLASLGSNVDLTPYALIADVDAADAYLQTQITDLFILNNNQQTELNDHDGRLLTVEVQANDAINYANIFRSNGHNVTPGGTIDGVNVAFTTPDVYFPASLKVYYNGLRLRAGIDYNETAGQDGFTMLYAIPMDASNWLMCDYII